MSSALHAYALLVLEIISFRDPWNKLLLQNSSLSPYDQVVKYVSHVAHFFVTPPRDTYDTHQVTTWRWKSGTSMIYIELPSEND
jgi:hypothetical protein